MKLGQERLVYNMYIRTLAFYSLHVALRIARSTSHHISRSWHLVINLWYFIQLFFCVYLFIVFVSFNDSRAILCIQMSRLLSVANDAWPILHIKCGYIAAHLLYAYIFFIFFWWMHTYYFCSYSNNNNDNNILHGCHPICAGA